MSALSSIVDSSRIIMCLGAGGVGKTTNAVGIALAAALRGKKTALISIDPAKRMAAAMGMHLGNTLTPVRLPGAENVALDAMMLDQKKVFDEMVVLFTKDGKTRSKIMQHPLYIAASSNFGGAVEYMALAKLAQMVREAKYDLIVVDTPPDSHALDFLNKPNILAGFMENRVMTWLIKPFYFAQKMGLSKLFTAGEKLAGGIAQVTGIKALQVLAEFLVLMQETIVGFHDAGAELEKVLRQDSTRFVLISTSLSAPLRAAEHMVEQMRDMGFTTDAVLNTRVLPADVQRSIATFPASEAKLKASKFCLRALYDTDVYSRQLFQQFLKKTEKILNKPILTQQVIEKNYDIRNAEGIVRYANELM